MPQLQKRRKAVAAALNHQSPRPHEARMADAGRAQIVLSATDQTRVAFDSARRNILGLQSTATGLASTLRSFTPIAGAAAAALSAISFRNVIDGADQLGKLSERTGVSVENLSSLAYAGKLADVSIDQLADAMKKLNLNIAAAARGEKEQAEAFKAIGVQVKNVDGSVRKADEVFDDLAESFASYRDGANKVALANAVGGRSFEALIPLLNGGRQGLKDARRELEQFGGVMTGELSKNAQQFNDNMTKLGTAAEALKIQLASGLVGELAKVSSNLVSAAKSGNVYLAVLEAILTTAAKFTPQAVVSGALLSATGITDPEVDKLQRLVARTELTIASFKEKLAADPGDLPLARRLEEAQSALARYQGQLQGLRAGAGRGFVNPPVVRPDRTPEQPDAPALASSSGARRAAAARSEAARYLDTLREQLAGTRDLTVAEKALREIQSGRLSGVTGDLREQILATAQLIDAAQRRQSQREAEAAQERDLAEEQSAAAQALANLRTAASQASEMRVAALEQEINSGIELNAALRDEIAIVTGGEEARRAIERARLDSAIALKEDTLAQLENAGAAQQEIQALQQQIALLKERGGLLGQRNVADDLAAKAAEQLEYLKSIGSAVAANFEDAVLQGGNLRSVLSGLEQDLLRIITRRLVTEPLAESITGVLRGGGAGIIGTVLGFRSGGYTGDVGEGEIAGVTHGREFVFDALATRRIGVDALEELQRVGRTGAPFKLSGFRDGGYVAGSARSQAGPRSAPETRSTPGSGSVSVVNHFAFAGPADRRTQQQVAAAAARGIEEAVARGTA
jgi:hypothetical protein